ncbi:hypothetical protein [Moraxella lacunata]|uniref:hypothetical protein n=1 Tax=Moraxella lacunata TaxID=477 RepID=UPI003EE3218E
MFCKNIVTMPIFIKIWQQNNHEQKHAYHWLYAICLFLWFGQFDFSTQIGL